MVRVQRVNEGSEAMQLPFDVRAQAIAAHKRLEEVSQRTGMKANLLEAVEYYIAHSMPTGGAKTCQEALHELLAFKKFKNRSEEYIKALNWSIGKFCRAFGARLLHEVGTDDCRRWLAENTRTPETCRAYIRDVGILFSFAIKRKVYCEPPKSIPTSDWFHTLRLGCSVASGSLNWKSWIGGLSL